MGVDIEANALPARIKVGTPFAISMKLTTGQLNVDGQVVWVVTSRQADTLPPRVGVAFGAMKTSTKELLRDVLTLRALPTPPWIAKLRFG